MNSRLHRPFQALLVIRKKFFPSCFKVTSHNSLSRSCSESKNITWTSSALQCRKNQVFNNVPFRQAALRSDGFLTLAKVLQCYEKSLKTDSTSNDVSKKENEPEKKLSIFQKFKTMYRDYWYVLVPVHIVTSAFWFGCFYYMARSGVDIAALAEMVHLSEETVEKIRKNSNSLAGHLAVSYLLYKVITPIRYTVTVGGTTVSINYLKKWGYVKPIPKKEELKKILEEKKVSFRQKRENFRARRDVMKRNVLDKFTQKKRVKKTSDLVRKILQNRRNQ